MSSAITQNAPCLLSNALIPKGFRISKNLNKKSERRAYSTLIAGEMRSGIHTPIISSITTFDGSSPQ